MDLPERFARGDLEAFELLFRQFYHEVYRWLVRLVRDPAAAEDLTVEVFWRIYRARARFDPTRSFGAWARRIASNAAIDHLRRVRRASAATAMPRPERQGQSTAQRDLHLRVERALLQLPARLRVVAELALIDGWPHDEIASALGLSRSAVKSRAFRALKSLKAAFEKEGIEP
jgi:RNA polymerase sigma-70 factor (ECF subfamily)